MFLSREIDKQLCHIYMKINVYTILYESMKIDQIQQISSQSENVDIPELES